MDQGFGLGWRQVAIGFLMLVATGMIAATYGVIAVPLEAEFGVGRGVLMLAMTVLSGVSALIAPFLGTLIDRTSIRNLMLLGAVLLSAGYAALSLATTFNHVMIVFGLLIAPANVLLGPVGVAALLSRWFSKRRAAAMGIAIAGVGAGGFIFPMVIQGLLNALPWRDAMQVLGLILFALTVPAALMVINRPGDRGLFTDGAASELDVAAAHESAGASAIRVLGDPAFWLCCLLFGLVTSGMKGMVTNLPPLAIGLGVEKTMAALLVTVYSGFAFVAKIGFAAIGDRVGPRTIMWAALGGFAAGMACMASASSFASIALGVGLTGLFGGMMVPLQGYLVPRIFGREIVGRAMGLMSSVTLIALLFTPPLFGWIFDVTGSYSGIFVFFAALSVLAMALVSLVRVNPKAVSQDLAAEADRPGA